MNTQKTLKKYLSADQTMFLQVEIDTMTNPGINKGDVVLIDTTTKAAKNGDLIVSQSNDDVYSLQKYCASKAHKVFGRVVFTIRKV
jgi:SOS-response transcriptional repressor LexA